MNRWDIINHLIKKNGYKSYLEIGYFKGWSFDNVNCNNKMAVDPSPSKNPTQVEAPYGSMATSNEDMTGGIIYKMTSDEFFQLNWASRKWDIIFIDGLHEAEQVLRDIGNSLKHLSEGGTIVVHDCNPPTLAHATTGDAAGNWNGDVYKAAVQVRCLSACSFYTIDTDWGVGIMKPNEPAEKIEDEWSYVPWQAPWEEFDKNRKVFLNLISVEEFLKREAMHATA